MNVVIVGGGNASLVLIEFLQRMNDATVKGIVDVDDAAPGMVRARELGIMTYRDVSDVAGIPDVETIIELTGNDGVRQRLISGLQPHQHFMSSKAARIMYESIIEQNRRRSEGMQRLSEEFTSLTSRLSSSEEYIDQSIRQIQDVLKSMKIVTMNARIEAARAGQNGKAFEVVVQAMQGTLGNIETALSDIRSASNEWKTTMASLSRTEDKLKASL